jgi:hypothetical protein
MVSATSTLFNTTTFYTGASANGIEQVNYAEDTFHLMLLASADSFDNNHSVQSQITTEITHQNYVAGGPALASVTFTVAASGTATFDAADVIVTASGTDLTAQAGVIYRNGTADPVLFFLDFQGTQTAGAGTNFNINWSADGIAQIKPA